MNIILIGFMGVGKTTIGKKLSDKIGYRFYDMDHEIEKINNININDIFKNYGEHYFRNLEQELLSDLLSSSEDKIISTGGGIISRQENIDLLKSQENVILLDANNKTIYKNIINEIGKRPLLKDSNDILGDIDKLLNTRKDRYLSASNFIINVDDKNIEQVVSDILVQII